MHELREVELRLPTQLRVGFRRIADEPVQLGRPSLERRIDEDMALPVESEVVERALHQVANGVALAGRHDVVAWFVLLQHQPDRANIVPCVPPVAPSIEITQDELVLKSERDRSCSRGDLAWQKLQRPARRLVVVEDSRARVEPVPAAVRVHDEMGVSLRYAVWRDRVRRRALGLRGLTRLAEDLTGRRLVE